MRALRAAGILVLAAFAASPAYAISLRDTFPETARLVGLSGGGAFDALGDAIADTAARNLPVVTGSAGFTYRYNPQLEVFERTSETLGPLFLERPDTLGQGKFNINVSYQYVDLNEFDGTSTGGLQASDPIVVRVADVTGTTIGFTANSLRYDFSLINHIVGLSFTYGLLDDLDVNVLLPLIWTDFSVRATTQQQFVSGTDLVFSPAPGPVMSAKLSETKFGVGDIFLRAKYQLASWNAWRNALGLWLRLPSGNKDNFQGTGAFEASPFYYGSTVLWGRVEPHVNFGVDLNSDDVGQSDVRYDLGADVDVTPRVGVALGFLGRSQFSGTPNADQAQFLHLTPNGPAIRPLLGLDLGRKDFYDLSFGTRVVVWRQIMVFVNGIYALNDEGLRNDSVIPMAGVEGTF